MYFPKDDRKKLNKDVTELNFTLSISVLFADQCILLKRFDSVVQTTEVNYFMNRARLCQAPCFHNGLFANIDMNLR